jgi:exodeoxyribonuclease VII small subunit
VDYEMPRMSLPSLPSFKVRQVPPGRWFVGHLWEFKRRPLDIMAAWRRQYGDLVRFQLGTRACYLLSHQTGLEESMRLWRRGEALAAHCSTWLDDAEATLTASDGD